ncbi:MAG: polyphosphate polymerase domain-containing protein [Fibromonadaceae bacterium]|jgi:hypothetical protein|nr:polyphosphate polymerase domain-containing protein [Fibromonadaceae bacterium]
MAENAWLVFSMACFFQKELSSFALSSLEESKAMSFQNRFDEKYVLNTNSALDFLKNIQNDYSLLQINDNFIQSYRTIYFDTPNLHCFNLHHNKRSNRFKFRTRRYLSNGLIFNEIKQKLNTGKTIKFRKKRNEFLSEFDGEFKFWAEGKGYDTENLMPQLYVDFNRITLLNKYFPERVTVDFELKYEGNNANIALNNMVIIELKRGSRSLRSISHDFFRKIHKIPSKFSKYAIGISLTHEKAKKNRFLPKIKSIAKAQITIVNAD